MVLIGDGNLSLHKIANKIHSIETNAPTKTKTAAPSSPLLPLLSLSSILFSLYFLSLSLSCPVSSFSKFLFALFRSYLLFLDHFCHVLCSLFLLSPRICPSLFHSDETQTVMNAKNLFVKLCLSLHQHYFASYFQCIMCVCVKKMKLLW